MLILYTLKNVTKLVFMNSVWYTSSEYLVYILVMQM